MKGQFFIEVVNDRLASQGQVRAEVGRGLYQLQFAGNPPAAKVVPAEKMGGMFFFDTRDQMEQWLKANTGKPEPRDSDGGAGEDPNQEWHEGLSVKELRTMAAEKGLKYAHRQPRAELIKWLEATAERVDLPAQQ